MSGRLMRLVRSAPCLALILALACASGAMAATAKTGTTGRKPGTHATARTRTAAPRRATAARTRAPQTAATNGAPRRLDDIAIEGEIPVPQVLFITARDQRRFLDASPSRYVRTSRQLADATPAPTRVMVVGDTAHAAAPGGSK